MAPVGKSVVTRGGGKPGVIIFLQGGDAGGPSVWIGFLGAVERDDEYGGEHPCGVPTPDHRLLGKTKIRPFMGDTGGRGCSMGGGGEVGGHIHRPLSGDGSTVGGPMTTIGGLHMGNRL